jgi:thiol-disulfide isomerase/thioredoxin
MADPLAHEEDPFSAEAMAQSFEDCTITKAIIHLVVMSCLCLALCLSSSGDISRLESQESLPLLPVIESWDSVPFATLEDVGYLEDGRIRHGATMVIMFYAEWCGHCKKTKPAFAEAASNHTGHVRFMRVDVDKNKDVATLFQISGYPTILKLDSGCVLLTEHGVDQTTANTIGRTKYSGDRTAQSFLEFAEESEPSTTYAGVPGRHSGESWVGFQAGLLTSYCILSDMAKDLSLTVVFGDTSSVFLLERKSIPANDGILSVQHLDEEDLAGIEPYPLVDLVKPQPEAVAAMQHSVFGQTLCMWDEDDHEFIARLMDRSKLPILFYPTNDDSRFWRADLFAHVVYFHFNQTSVSELLNCPNGDACMRFVTFSGRSMSMFDVPEDDARDTAEATLEAVLVRLAGEGLDEHRVEVTADVVSSAGGTELSNHKTGTVATLTASNVQDFISAARDGTIPGLMIAFMQEFCEHCKSFEPEFEAAAAQDETGVVYGMFDISANTFVAALDKSVKGTPELRFVGSKVSGKGMQPVTHARTADNILAATRRLASRTHEEL